MAKVFFSFFFFFTLTVVPGSGQDLFIGYEHLFTPPRTYIVHRTDQSITIDGKPEEKVWKDTRWSEFFVDIEGGTKPEPAHNTRVKMLWDREHLFILAELDEPHIWATLDKHDQIIYHDNDFEVFIDPEGNTHSYYEIEVNAFNTIFDLYMPKPYRNGGSPDIGWNVNQLRSAIYIDGTVNNPNDEDKKWYVEMAIPFRSLSTNNGGNVPSDGSVWNMNFSRVHWDTEVIKGKYKKIMDTIKNRPLPEYNWVWSPQGVINMHFPERWGFVMFSKSTPENKDVTFSLPSFYEVKKYLYLIYYKQNDFHRKHKRYASLLSDLNIPESVVVNNRKGKLLMQTSDKKFLATINIENVNSWQIDQEGKIIQR